MITNNKKRALKILCELILTLTILNEDQLEYLFVVYCPDLDFDKYIHFAPQLILKRVLKDRDLDSLFYDLSYVVEQYYGV